MADANFPSVQILLRANGTDGSSTITDESSVARGMTRRGNAQLDTAQKKYGLSSILYDGTGDAVTPNSVTGLSPTGDFTVEFWWRPNTTDYAALFCPMADWWIDTNGLYYDPDTLEALFSASPTTGSFHHIAWTRSGSTNRLYLDGVHQGSFTKSGTITASSTLYSIGSFWSGSAAFNSPNGWIDDFRVTIGVARYTGTGSFTPPTEHELGGFSAYIEAASPLGAFNSVVTAGKFNVRAAFDSPLDDTEFSAVAFADFTVYLAAEALQKHVYYMDLVTPDGLVRVPISSWQATLQTDSECYAGCVVPACGEWVDYLSEATEFIISRRALLASGSTIEVQMVRAPVQSLTLDQGATNQTASLAGYPDEIALELEPHARYDRTLTNIQSTSVYLSGVRVRCSLDWLLRPATRAHYNETSMVVSYINYYVVQNQTSIEAYIDVGERIAAT